MMVTAAIILAASDATSDGLPLALMQVGNDTTLIEWQIEQLQLAGVEVIEVVLGYEADRILSLVSGNDVEPIIDGRWQDGEASCLRTAASAVPRDTQTAIIVGIDYPVSRETCRRLLATHRDDAEVTRAAVDGATLRLPVVVGATVLGQLRNVSAERGLDAIVATYTDGANVVTIESRALPASES